MKQEDNLAYFLWGGMTVYLESNMPGVPRLADKTPKNVTIGHSSIGIRTRLATGWKVRGSSSGVIEIFSTRPYQPWGPPNLLHHGYRVIPRVKRSGRGVDLPPQTSVEVKERGELYLYSLWAFMDCYRVNTYFSLLFILRQECLFRQTNSDIYLTDKDKIILFVAVN